VSTVLFSLSLFNLNNGSHIPKRFNNLDTTSFSCRPTESIPSSVARIAVSTSTWVSEDDMNILNLLCVAFLQSLLPGK
jgi:hypothetical protein